MTQAVNLANFANNLDSSGGLNPSALNAATPVSKGGTASTTASAARTALGVDYATIAAAMYPVGSIYINASVSTNPATLFGFGTWVAFGAGRVPVGTGGGFTAGDTGGSADAVVVAHTHTGTTNNGGSATGSLSGGTGPGDVGIFDSATGVWSVSGYGPNQPNGTFGGGTYYTANMAIPDHTHGFTTASTGVTSTNANLQPYIVVYMWTRTA